MKIGYQGDIGSNSEEAAKQFVKKLNIKNFELIPLISSKNIVENLKNKNIDFGVCAVYNSIGGIVEETKEATNGLTLNIKDTLKIPIHHCLFKKKNVPNEKLEFVTSHIQALKQTKNNRDLLFSNLREFEVEDTAIAAKNLSNNILNDNICVLCRKNAGESNDLELIYENLEDKIDNQTKFILFKII